MCLLLLLAVVWTFVMACPDNFARTGCVTTPNGFSCRFAEPWVREVLDAFVPQDESVIEKESLLVKRIREAAVSPSTPGTLCCVDGREILCERPSDSPLQCPKEGYLDTGCEVNQKNEVECVREAEWLAGKIRSVCSFF